MFNVLGRSVYVNDFDKQREKLELLSPDIPVFLSLHISEEFSKGYKEKAIAICHWLADHKFKIIADVSPKTVVQFNEKNLVSLAQHMRLWALRIDYGFSTEDICEIAKQFPVVLNASTTSYEQAKTITSYGKEVYAQIGRAHV